MEQIRLDNLDRKILFELDKNSRQSFSELGKKVRLKKETVFQRVKRLQDKGIIEQFQTIINIHSLGYQNYRLLIKLKRVDDKITAQIIDSLIKSKLTGWVVKCEGNWDLAVWYQVVNLHEFKVEYEKLKRNFSNYISNEKLSIFTDVVRYSKSFLINEDNHYELNIELSNKQMKVSRSDGELLKSLAKDSRVSLVDLSDQLKLSTKTILKRIKFFEKEKVILGYGMKMNLLKMGYSHFKIHINLDNLNQESIKEIHEIIYLNKNITWLNNSISGFDLDIDVDIESFDKLGELLGELKRVFKKNIVEYEILSYKKEYKQNFL